MPASATCTAPPRTTGCSATPSSRRLPRSGDEARGGAALPRLRPGRRAGAARTRRPRGAVARGDARALGLRRLRRHHLPVPDAASVRPASARAPVALRRGWRQPGPRPRRPAAGRRGAEWETRHIRARKSGAAMRRSGTMPGIFCGPFAMLTFPDRGTTAMATAKHLLLGVLEDGVDLANRVQANRPFRTYLEERAWLVVPAAVLIVIASLACAMGLVLFVGGTRPLLVLFSLVLAPFVLAGSVLVQAYVFVSWLEKRALAQALGHRLPRRGGVMVVPSLLVALFVATPLAMLSSVAPTISVTILVLLIAAPFAYARLDR